MLFARRRLWWLTALAAIFANCNDPTTPSTVTVTPTSVIIEPEAFLGGAACGTEAGGLLRYQATLLDVTKGLSDAPRLPSSPVVGCSSTVVFEAVTIGRRYAAAIAAFDRDDVRAKKAGSAVVVDGDGEEVEPAWTTLCTGHDGEIDEALGGAGGQDPGEGGWTGNSSLGVLAVEHAVVPVRGCAPLSGSFDPNLTGVRVHPTSFLGALGCGDDEGQVGGYSAVNLADAPAAGGAGGAGGMGGAGGDDERTSCDEAFILRGLPPGTWVTLEVLAYEAGASSPSWSTTCTARTAFGALVDGSCDRLRPL